MLYDEDDYPRRDCDSWTSVTTIGSNYEEEYNDVTGEYRHRERSLMVEWRRREMSPDERLEFDVSGIDLNRNAWISGPAPKPKWPKPRQAKTDVK